MKAFRPETLLEPGEKLVWSHTPAEPAHSDSRSRNENLEYLYKAVTYVQFTLALLFLIRGLIELSNGPLSKFVLSLLFLSGGLVLVRLGPRLRRWYLKQGHQLAYANCVITNRRVLLFNHLSGDLIALSRKKLSLVERDYVQGSLGLVFHSNGQDDTAAFISASHLGAAFKALQRG